VERVFANARTLMFPALRRPGRLAALPSILKYVLKKVFEWVFGLREGEVRIGDDDIVTNSVEDEWGCLGTKKRFRMLKKHKSKPLWETRENKLVDKIAEVALQTGKATGDLVENMEVSK
jgi:hypothetical protein